MRSLPPLVKERHTVKRTSFLRFALAAIFLFITKTSLNGAEPPKPLLADEPRGTPHTIQAGVGYPAGASIGIQAVRQPGEFTIVEGTQATKLKYSFADPKLDYTSTKLRGSNIYSVTEKRFMRELDSDPTFALPPGDYRFVVGGSPGATGTLSFTTVPRPDTSLPPKPPGGPKTSSGNSPPPSAILQPGGEDVLLNLPRDFDVRPTSVSPAESIGKWNEMIFRFRGKQVTVDHEFTMPVDSAGLKSQLHGTCRIQGEFVRGRLIGKGSFRYFNRDVDQGIDFAEFYAEANVVGQANADGRLVIPVAWKLKLATARDGIGQGPNKPIAWAGWKDRTAEYSKHITSWQTDLTFQLPVGELQSNQKFLKDAPTDNQEK